MGYQYTVLHAADLAAQLPTNSRCMRALEPALDWGRQDHLLAEAVNMLRLLVWAQSKDGYNGRNRPQMIQPPKARVQTGLGKGEGVAAREYRAILMRQRV